MSDIKIILFLSVLLVSCSQVRDDINEKSVVGCYMDAPRRDIGRQDCALLNIYSNYSYSLTYGHFCHDPFPFRGSWSIENNYILFKKGMDLSYHIIDEDNFIYEDYTVLKGSMNCSDTLSISLGPNILSILTDTKFIISEKEVLLSDTPVLLYKPDYILGFGLFPEPDSCKYERVYSTLKILDKSGYHVEIYQIFNYSDLVIDIKDTILPKIKDEVFLKLYFRDDTLYSKNTLDDAILTLIRANF